MSEPNDAAARWRRAFSAFERLIALDETSRAREIEALRADDPTLWPQLRTLLRADEEAESHQFMDGSVFTGRTSSLEAGATLGAYRLERRLGEGGMGEVWLARRADGLFETPVALKLLHVHLGKSAARERFVREGRILGELGHAHIARLLDAGVLPDGQLYLALEYIQGERLDRWCDEQQLPIRARVQLFLQVCEAAAHAHAHLVVHRDLKPGNILVTPDGQVKLLDFGIAKLVQDEQTDTPETELTRLGGRALTPEYAAPEQIAGGPITVATDVYALGVVLYQLLSGRRPYAESATTAAEIERAVLDTEPAAMSGATAQKLPADTTVTLQDLAGLRASTPRALREALRGDLDTIVAKALKKPPAERYATVQMLAEDLRRYLDDRPILARPDSLSYRLRKYVRRHSIAVAAAVAVVVVLIAGMTTTVWQAQRAKAQAQRAERVKDFTISIFQEQNPFVRSASAALTPQQMIDNAVARLDQELGNEPDVRAELLDDLAGIELDIDAKNAEPLVQRALDERRARYGSDSLEAAASLYKMARLRSRQARVSEAQSFATEAVQILSTHSDADPVMLALAQRELAHTLLFRGQHLDQVIQLLLESINGLEKRLGREHPETQRALNWYADALVRTNATATAETVLDDAANRAQRHYGQESVPYASVLARLGDVQVQERHLNAALASFERVAAIMSKQLGSRSQQLAASEIRIAMILRDQRRYAEALRAADEAMAALTDDSTANKTDILRGRGRIELLLGQTENGERDLRAAYNLYAGSNSKDDPFAWYLASEWGSGLIAIGKISDAEALQRKALERAVALMGKDAYLNLEFIGNLADTLEKRGGAIDEVLALRRRQVEIVTATSPEPTPAWADHAALLARSLALVDSEDARREGLDLSTRVLASRRLGSEDPEALAEALTEHAGFLAAAGKTAEAQADAAEALQVFGRSVNPDAATLQRARALAGDTKQKT